LVYWEEWTLKQVQGDDDGMAKTGRFLAGSFPAQERTDRYRVCLAPIGAMSVYQGWFPAIPLP
jgi:hypothetical protein